MPKVVGCGQRTASQAEIDTHCRLENPGNVAPDDPAAPDSPVTGIRATTQRRIRNALSTKEREKDREARRDWP